MGLCTQLHGWPQIPMELASILVCGVGATGDVPFQLVVCWRSLESLLNVGHWWAPHPYLQRTQSTLDTNVKSDELRLQFHWSG